MDLILRLFSLLLRGTALMLGLVGLAFAAACLGGAFSDRLDALTHFAPLWLAMGVGAVVLGAISARQSERWAIVGLGLATVAACAVLMGPELWTAARFKPLAPREGDLKIVQFNVWHDNRTPDRTLEWLIAQDADLLILEEGGGTSTSVIVALKKVYPFVISCAGRRACDSWIFSRKPMVAAGGMYRQGQRFAGVWATIDDPKGDFTVIGAHYVWPVPAGPQQKQVQLLAKAASRFDKSGLIVTGDFNSTPWSFTLKDQDKALDIPRRTLALPSWPAGKFSRLLNAPVPFLPIDHVYAGPSWTTVSVERGPSLGSDHRPIVVHLRR
jgi:endonuclease/exonuclease/phosphatase (EEP) superfamily protein YafD